RSGPDERAFRISRERRTSPAKHEPARYPARLCSVSHPPGQDRFAAAARRHVWPWKSLLSGLVENTPFDRTKQSGCFGGRNALAFGERSASNGRTPDDRKGSGKE